MVLARPSETTTGRTTALIFRVMETPTISKLSQVSTQDGGSSSDSKENSL
jgi:hypothetical protein